MPAGKKVTKRKPGITSKNYFTSETQDAIVTFKQTESPEERKRIYTEKILPAFSLLVENLINVYGFHVLYEDKTDLINHCVADLFEIVCKFNPSKGSKAFSYFNVVAKNWLTIRAKTSAKNMTALVSINNKDAFTQRELEIIENHSVVQSADEVVTLEEQRDQIQKIIDGLKANAKTEQEVSCVNAIQVLFDGIDDLEFINKRAIMLYIREITNIAPKQLSMILSLIRKQYKLLKIEEFKDDIF